LKRILILSHEDQPPIRRYYLIYALREVWRKWGLQVSCLHGIGDLPEADLLIPHIDLTHTPPEYVECIRSFPCVVNRSVVDISKRKISTNLLCRNEEYRGPVIVKTDNNFGGLPEYLLFQSRHPYLAWIRPRLVSIAELGQHLAWRRVWSLLPKEQ